MFKIDPYMVQIITLCYKFQIFLSIFLLTLLMSI